MLTEKSLGHRYCSECMEGPKLCVILSVDFEQVVLCQKCFAEVGTLFEVGDDELEGLPDDAHNARFLRNATAFLFEDED